MKRSLWAAITLVAIFSLVLAGTISAQDHINEDWSSGNGLTPPAGWSTRSTSANPANWRFDNPVGRIVPSPLAGLIAVADSAFAGTNFTKSFLRSPVFDTMGAPMTIVSYDHFLDADPTTIAQVQIFDGAMWNDVQNSSVDIGTTAAGVSELFDVTALVSGVPNARLRFQYTSNLDWFWMVDNVRLRSPLANDLAILSFDAPAPDSLDCTVITSTMTTVTCTIVNDGSNTILNGTVLSLDLIVDGGLVANEPLVLAADLLPNATLSFTFTATADISTVGVHTITVTINFAPLDPNTANNTVTLNLTNPRSIPRTAGWFETFDSLPDNSGAFIAPAIDTVPAGWENDLNDVSLTSPQRRPVVS